jgi:hypothetical protein
MPDDHTTSDDDNLQVHRGIQHDMRQDNDGKTPFSTPDDVKDTLDDTSQQFDTDIADEDVYDEGMDGASDVDLPPKSDVLSYDPEQDTREKA